MSNRNNKSLETWIWDAACSIRGAKDAPKSKDYILRLSSPSAFAMCSMMS
jgi:type I restriction enzyme M protein